LGDPAPAPDAEPPPGIPGGAGNTGLIQAASGSEVEPRPLERSWPRPVTAGAAPIAGWTAAIAHLEEERDGLRAQGIARAGCWIETGEVQGRQFRQAWWRSHQAMFPAKRDLGQGRGLVKSLYIGEEGSEAHRIAIAQRDRRNRVRQIDRQLQKLKGCGE
jgi:hypothetical protein